MISTLAKDLKIIKGQGIIVPKEYPDWYGIPNIGFIWHGEWSDAEIEYKGKRINSTIVENTMWESFREECVEQGREADNCIDYFDDYYMKEHADEVYELIELAMEE